MTSKSETKGGDESKEKETNDLHISATEDEDGNLDRLLDSIHLTGQQLSSHREYSLRLKPSLSSKSLKSILKKRGDDSSYESILACSPPSRSNSFGEHQGTQIGVRKNDAPTFKNNNNSSDQMDVSLSSLDSTSTRRASLGSASAKRGSCLRRTPSQVSFKSVEIREYDRTLGDNPACMSGPPISLDWSYSKESEICMEEYEKSKRKGKYIRRMAKQKRVDLLTNHLGYTEDEIEAATKEKKLIQRSRAISKMISPLWRVEHAAESAGRKLKKAMNKGHKSEGDMTEISNANAITLDVSNSSSILEF